MHTSIHLHVPSETRALFCLRMLTQTVTRVEQGEIKKPADDKPHTNSVHACRGEAAQLPAGSGPESSLTRAKQHFLAEGLSVDTDRWGQCIGQRFERSHGKVRLGELHTVMFANRQTALARFMGRPCNTHAAVVLWGKLRV